jgi:signal transduction histidine kinase/ActR/RegA family two-component response regulator
MSDFFSTDGFMPHGHCYLWNPDLIALHVVSDATIAAAYFCIPFVLYYMIKKRSDIPYKWVIGLFAVFILACGTTHLMEIYTLWHPEYWITGMIKALTAVVSIATALALLPLVPKILTLQGPAELKRVNSILAKEIEDRKTIEAELIKAAKLKSSFLANMSHEIRTPINGILGLTNAVLDSDISADNRRSLDLVRKSGEHLFSLLNDILDFSKIDAGKLEFEELDFNLPDFLSDTIEMHKLSASKKGLPIQFVTHGTLPDQIKSDPTRLRQIINNLLSNAIKFTPQGEVRLEVRALPTAQESDQVRLEFQVSDTGIGIPGDKQNEIFGSFSQADASTSRKYGGSGLGLSICKRLIELMGGQIRFESNPGVGTRFAFDLLVKKSHAQLPRESGAVVEKYLFKKTFRVLVAEDNAVNQVVTGKMLQKIGITPDFVANGKEVVEVLSTTNYDAVLMDCQMPEMDGFEATRLIREREKGTDNHIKIIAMTASAMKGDKEKCLLSGMDDYLSKPLRIVDLYTVLKNNFPILDC